MLSSSIINKVLSSSLHLLYSGITFQKLTTRQQHEVCYGNYNMSCNSIVLIARSSRDLSFLSSWFFVFLGCCIFCYNRSFQNRNSKKESVFSTKQHGLFIRFKLYVLKTEISILHILVKLKCFLLYYAYWQITYYSNIRKVFFLSKTSSEMWMKTIYDQLTLF